MLGRSPSPVVDPPRFLPGQQVEWLAVDLLRRTRRRSLIHIVRDENETLCSTPIPGLSWLARDDGGGLLVCRVCLRVRAREESSG